jgi:hypothetical protein
MSSLLGWAHAPAVTLTTETAQALVARRFAVSKSMAANSGGSQPTAIRSMRASSPGMANMNTLATSSMLSSE